MNRLRILPLIILLSIAAGCQSLVRLSGDVLLYNGPGAEESCIDNTEELLENLGWEVRRAGPDYFAEYGCAGFSLVVFPGGDMYQYAADLGGDAKDAIRGFLADGGGYLGICGGSYFAASRVFWQGNQLPMEPLALFSGDAVGPIDEIAPYPECEITGLHVVETEHPITAGLEPNPRFNYCYGPYFVPDDDAPDVLHRYDTGEGAASLAFDYGAGRVFIIGLHPELTIVDDGDGGIDYHPDSYALIDAAVDWILEER